MRFLSTFSGIGGFDLGLERAGWECVGQIEIDEFCSRVLAKHWPNVWRAKDVRNVTGKLIQQHCGDLEALIGGPPCQPSSVAGQRRGSSDERWMWPDFLRMVSEINHAQEEPVLWLLAENPRGVLSLEIEELKFSDWLARELAIRGYELLPVELAAEDVGAPHKRERVWFVAYCKSDRRREGRAESERKQGRPNALLGRSNVAYGNSTQQYEPQGSLETQRGWAENGSGGDVAHSGCTERGTQAGETDEHKGSNRGREKEAGGSELCGEVLADSSGIGEREQNNEKSAVTRQRTRQNSGGRSDVGVGQADTDITRSQEHSREREDNEKECAPTLGASWLWPARPGQPQHEWEEARVITAQSSVGSSIDRSARRLARWRNASLKALGNAVVPQCAEVLGRVILEIMEGP